MEPEEQHWRGGSVHAERFPVIASLFGFLENAKRNSTDLILSELKSLVQMDFIGGMFLQHVRLP
jgi:hypothetical protein